MPDKGWSREFDDPIPVPRGRQLVTLQDAGKYITRGAGVAGCDGGLNPGRGIRWADDVCADRHHAGAKSSHRARVQPGSQGPSLGKAEAETGRMSRRGLKPTASALPFRENAGSFYLRAPDSCPVGAGTGI
jgi:hypothetical protein